MRRLRFDHFVDDPVLNSFLRRHEKVAITIRFDLTFRLVAVIGNVGVEHFPDEKDLLGLDLDISGLPLGATQGLVDHNPRIGQGPAFALGPGAEQERSHAGGHAEANGLDVARNIPSMEQKETQSEDDEAQQ